MAQQQPKQRHLVDLAEASAYIARNPKYLRRLVASRQIPYHKIGGRLRFDLADLDELIDASRIEAVPP